MVIRRPPRRASAPVELAPRTIREVEFRERVRGYDPDDVDPFLDEVADRVASLQQQFDRATARLERMKARAGQPLSDLLDDEAVALVAALLHVQAAHAEATRIVRAARQQARAIEHAAREERRARRQAAARPARKQRAGR